MQLGRLPSVNCPHCNKPIEWQVVLEELRLVLGIFPKGRVQPENERTSLIAWLLAWRENCGLPKIELRGRSTAQLRKMFEAAQIGKQYRLGRKWKSTRSETDAH
jgi:hypothetical protein